MNISSVESTSTFAAIHTLKVSHLNNGVVARDASYNLRGIEGGIPSLKQLALEAFIKGNEHKLNQLNGDIEEFMNTQLTQLKPSVTTDELFVKPTLNEVVEAFYFHQTLTGFGRILGSPKLNVVSISKYEIKTPLQNEPLKFTGYAKRDKNFPIIFTPFNENPDELLEYETKNPNVNLYIREVRCILDPITQKSIYYPTGTGKTIEKKPDGTIIEQEGTWGPVDPKNPQSKWYLTGNGKIITKLPDKTIREQRGTWGPKDPTNLQSPWHLTGNGKKIEKKLDGTILEQEGTWGPVDQTNLQGPWGLFAQNKDSKKRKRE